MKKVLILASVASMISQFNMGNIRLLQEMGYEVHVACNFKEGNTCDEKSIRELKKNLKEMHVEYFQIDFSRDMKNIGKHLKAYRQVMYLLRKNGYQFMHCHSPIGGVIGRFAAHRTHTKVIYTAHGFHFYKGAPVKSWLLYFPVEWICSFWTDVLITINKEDYAFAQKHLHAKKTEYVPGVGIDIKKFSPDMFSDEERMRKRLEIGIKKDEKLLLSVGELIPRKNHESVIKAIGCLADSKVKYYICGRGELQEYLQKLIEKAGLQDRVKLLGYRTDVSQLCDCADLFVFPSLQEGLPVALMEAVASKTPVICSNIRGNTELVEEGALFDPKDVPEIIEKIEEYLYEDKSREIGKNYEKLKKYDVANVMKDLCGVMCSGGVEYLIEFYNRQLLRKSIKVPLDAKLLLSVGELNKNKNHEIVIRAIAQINDKSLHYVIAGKGELYEYLIKLADSLSVGNRVHLLGYRNDIVDLYKCADLYIHPSLREGLSVALMEIVASKKPVICSNIRGNVDFIDKSALFSCKDVNMLVEKINTYINDGHDKEILGNYERLKNYDILMIFPKMRRIYSACNSISL